MTDREKVIKALELCTSKIETRTQIPCATCPYHNRKYHGVLGDGCCNARSLQRDALALLKAQEPRTVLNIFKVHEGTLGNCPTCGSELMDFYNETYCGRCGQAVKWDG